MLAKERGDKTDMPNEGYVLQVSENQQDRDEPPYRDE